MIWRKWQKIVIKVNRAVLFAALFFCGSLSAEQITITSNSGSLTLTGKFIGYDGTFLQIETDFGPVSLNFATVSCLGADCPNRNNYIPKIRIVGAPRVAKTLMPALVEGFARSHQLAVSYSETDLDRSQLVLFKDETTVAEFTIVATNAEDGFSALVSHDADMALSLRPTTEEENLNALEAGIGRLDGVAQHQIIGYDADVPISSPRRSLDQISIAQLQSVLQREIEDWSELGSGEGPIQLFLSSTNDFETEQQVVSSVTADINALGLVSVQNTIPAKLLQVVDQCGFVTSARPHDLKTRDYPLVKPIYLYLPERRQSEFVTEFLSWLGSNSAQLVVRRSGFVDSGVISIPLESQGQRISNAVMNLQSEEALGQLQSLLRLVEPMSRRSVSFRFEPSSQQLDPPSQSDLWTLARALRSGGYSGKTVALLGFSTETQSGISSLSNSEILSTGIHEELRELLGNAFPSDVNFVVEGFGDILPLACDESLFGAYLNSRVELWVSD